ncbi:hypothetical protein JCM6882_005279 [Rhodosporidiobolus microsporus]
MSDTDPPPDPVDPREEDYLPPWLWLTLCILCLICLLFISFRRAQSLELYQRARDHLLSKLPFSLHRGIHLTDRDLSTDPFAVLPTHHTRRRPVEADLEDDDRSDTFSIHSPDRDDFSAPSASLRSYSFAPSGTTTRLASSAAEQVQRGLGSVLDTLGWGSNSSPASGGARGGEKTAGIAQAFWGLRRQDRTGGIRLGGRAGDDNEAAGGPSPASARLGRRNELSGVGGAISRIFDVAGSGSSRTASPSTRASSAARSGSGHHRASSASSVSSGTALFEVGNDADAGDAVELPTHFSLATPSSGASGATSSSGSSARESQRA